ncbi:MAG: metal-dependent transcriptional regulator [Desulfobacterota bacterium]|nr:metal-dependent transcriptional regulator [Thermodesulfobacteriota bacterium]
MEKKELDEYIEALWYLTEQGTPCVASLKEYLPETFSQDVLDELVRQGLIIVETEGKIIFTPKGHEQSRQIVRCHRLAERLLTDVLGMQPQETERGACEFEHIIAPEIVDSICTLLGHPRECPHGLKIPEGRCCQGGYANVRSAIVSLDRVPPGTEVKIAYINALSNSRMHKLSHFGIMPGATVKVHQRYPSFVVQCGNTQIAMEEAVARDVFVFAPQSAEVHDKPRRRRWRFGGKWLGTE